MEEKYISFFSTGQDLEFHIPLLIKVPLKLSEYCIWGKSDTLGKYYPRETFSCLVIYKLFANLQKSFYSKMHHGSASTSKCCGPKYFKTNFQISDKGYGLSVSFFNFGLKWLSFSLISCYFFYRYINSELGIRNNHQFS